MNFPLNNSKSNGLTALSIAIVKNNPEIVKILIDSGADVSHIGKNGVTALYMAMKQNNMKLFKLLLDHGAQAFN